MSSTQPKEMDVLSLLKEKRRQLLEKIEEYKTEIKMVDLAVNALKGNIPSKKAPTKPSNVNWSNEIEIIFKDEDDLTVDDVIQILKSKGIHAVDHKKEILIALASCNDIERTPNGAFKKCGFEPVLHGA